MHQPLFVLRGQRLEKLAELPLLALPLRRLKLLSATEEHVGPGRLPRAHAHVRMGIVTTVGEAPSAEAAGTLAALESKAA